MKSKLFRFLLKKEKRYIYSDQKEFCFLGNSIKIDGVGLFNIDERLQQYTGLNDKNGNKIFEGDWITSPFGSGKVVWNCFSYRVEEEDGQSCFPLCNGIDFEIVKIIDKLKNN